MSAAPLCEWPGGCNRPAKTSGARTGRRLCLGHMAKGTDEVRRRWRAVGRCRRCGAKPEPGRLACEACLERDRKRKRRGRSPTPGRWSAKARRDAVFAYKHCPRMRVAALAAGVSERTLLRARRRDPALDAELREARMRWFQRNIHEIFEAGGIAAYLAKCEADFRGWLASGGPAEAEATVAYLLRGGSWKGAYRPGALATGRDSRSR